MDIPTLTILIILSFIAGFLGSSLRIGYGAVLAPILMLLGYDPRMSVFSVLFSQFITEFFNAAMHHNLGNADFSRYSRDIRYAVILGLGSTAGFIGAFISMRTNGIYIEIYTGILILTTGVLLGFYLKNKNGKTPGKGLFGVGFLASLNKSITGGGYSASILLGSSVLGLNIKKTIAILSIAEIFVCLSSVIGYIFSGIRLVYSLIVPLTIGSILSVYPATKFVNRTPESSLKKYSGTTLIIIGLTLIAKTLA